MGDTNARFSRTYAEARDRFRAATAGLDRGAIDVVDGLTIDWAWTGDGSAKRVRVVSSGLHGVEGFPGSAAQLEMLAQPDDTLTLWLHALNPWGMANLRRFNESNVDLNRNFLAPGEAYEGAPAHYATMDPLLNPPTPPAFDFFHVKAGLAILKHGFAALKNAIVGGQYAYPKGLFFGGARLEEGPRKLLAFLDGALRGRERVVHIDLHSGLGRFAGRTLLLDDDATPDAATRARAAFGPSVKAWEASNPDAYTIRGGLTKELARRLPGVRYDGMTLEFGTSSNLAVVAALREENRLHHWGEPRLDHAAKQAVLEAFNPDHPAFRAAVIHHARGLLAPSRRMLELD